jgi:hypothetical protein
MIVGMSGLLNMIFCIYSILQLFICKLFAEATIVNNLRETKKDDRAVQPYF